MPTVGGSPQPAVRDQILQTAKGVLSEAYPLQATAAAAAIPATLTTSGSVFASMVGLKAGDVITNLITNVTVTGTGLTFAKMGMWVASTSALAASTANDTADFTGGSTGTKVVPLTAPYVVPADGGYYVGFLQYGNAATGCTLARGSSNVVSYLGTGIYAPSVFWQGQQDIVGPATWTQSASIFWFAVN